VPGIFLLGESRYSPTLQETVRSRDKEPCDNIKVGTFDVSLLTIDDGIFEVNATAGDGHLGKSLVEAF